MLIGIASQGKLAKKGSNSIRMRENCCMANAYKIFLRLVDCEY